MTYYHVVAPLEDRFSSVDEALQYFQNNPFIPRVPEHAMDGEDTTIPRICVSPSVELCLTAIGILGTFRRCLAANRDAFDYCTEGLEVYPIIVCEFDDPDVYAPTLEQVPDGKYTREMWLTKTTKPNRVNLKWICPYSIIWDKKSPSKQMLLCKKVTFVEPNALSKHPWLNNFGSKMDSSKPEPLWRSVESSEYALAYISDGELQLDKSSRTSDLNKLFDMWCSYHGQQPTRYIVPTNIFPNT